MIEYYASSEESQIYRCMRTNFYLSPTDPEISMNFTFSFTDDPENEQLYGNITWRIPNGQQPSHWVHSEDPCTIHSFFLLNKINLDAKSIV